MSTTCRFLMIYASCHGFDDVVGEEYGVGMSQRRVDEVVVPGVLSREETATYPGVHSIECLVVKDGYLVARSGPFLVNIA